MIVEKVSGKPYAQFLEDEFFKPLGLAGTSYCETRPLIKRRARGYERAGGGWVNAEYLSMSQPYAAGSLCSTVGDLVRWNAALVRGQVVRPASYALMAGPSTQLDGTPIKNGYGFGLGSGKFGDRRAVAHSGGIHGFSVDMGWLPDDSVLVVALTNAGSPAAGRLIRLAAAAALGDPLPGSARVTLTDAERARYAGEYRLTLPNGSPLDVRVWSEGGQLRVHPTGQAQSTLVPQGDHAFVDANDPNIRVRFTLENGRATKLTLMQGGATLEAPRIR
jgi:CubicO group peptidase (beta-lactamase class C family)